MGFFSKLFSKLKRNKNTNLLNEGTVKIDANSQKRTTYKDDLVVDPNSFEGLDSTAIQKKCLAIVGVSPELSKSDIVRDKIFDRCYAQSPNKMIDYLKARCTISTDKPNSLIIKDEKLPGSSNTATFTLSDNILEIASVDVYKNALNSTEITENSKYDKNGLQLSNSLKKVETPLNEENPSDKILRDYEITRQKDIDKAIFVNNINRTKCAIDLLSTYHDISKIFVELTNDVEKQPLNVYIPPRDIVMQDFDEDVTIVTLSGIEVRNSKIYKRIQESSNKHACMQYVKNNDIDLYNYFESIEQDKE